MNAPRSIKTRMEPAWKRGRGHLSAAPAAPTPPRRGRIPRVTKLLALAHRFEWLLNEGVVKDYAELASLGQVTRARITQIMNLLNLAPEIQEEILFLSPVDKGRDRLTERKARLVSLNLDWEKQQLGFKQVLRGSAPE